MVASFNSRLESIEETEEVWGGDLDSRVGRRRIPEVVSEQRHSRPPCGFRVEGSGFGVQGLELRVWGYGFGVWGLGVEVWVWGLEFGGLRVRAWGLGLRVEGLGFRVWD